MAYLAFYRMFRPTSFDEVVRQEHIVKILKNQIETGRIGHAYLFCGPRGTGKTTLAKIFARAINCESPRDGSPCGKCPTCKALAGSSALDISEIDAASNNGVDEMRDLREKVQYPPVNGKYKVYIIDEVHMLTQSAFNAVLKTLEEPPSHAVFILATTEPQKIPATILSRCMRFDFKLIPLGDLEGLIKDVFDKTGKEYEDEAVAAIARAGNGSARDCLSIADMCASYSRGKLTYDDVNKVLGKADFEAIGEIAAAIAQGDAGEALSATENVLSTGKSVGVLLRDLLSYFNNLAVVKTCRNAREILNLPEEKFKALKEISTAADGHAILRATEILSAAEGDLRFAVDGRITVETAIMKAAVPAAEYDIDSLISRIEALERAVKEGVNVKIKEYAPANAGGAKTYVAPAISARQPAEKQQTEGVQPAGKQQIEDIQPAEKKRLEEAQPEKGRTNGDTAPQKAQQQAESPIENRGRTRGALLAEEEAPSPFGESAGAQTNKAQSNNAQTNSAQQNAGQPAQPSSESSSGEQGTLFEQRGAADVKVSSLSEADKNATFGRLLRLFRTTRRNAVLFSLCSDLDSFYDGDTFVLVADTEAVCKSLNRDDNRAYIAEALQELGVFSFDIRVKANGDDKYEKALGELRNNFKGSDIQIK